VFSTGEKEARLQKLRNMLAAVPRKTLIHFEMASFTDESLLRQILDGVVAYSDSLGMNEQELPNLVSMLTNGNVSLVADAHPRIAAVLDHMRLVYDLLKDAPAHGDRRRLTRLHIHTLAFQAILTTKGSSWKNTMSATAKASLTANRHVCGSDYIHTMNAKLLMDESFASSTTASAQRIYVQDNRPVACWEESDYLICVAPNLVCTKIFQTAGGGDNISSAGLAVQV
jgi:ADP-dependent glucokinase